MQSVGDDFVALIDSRGPARQDALLSIVNAHGFTDFFYARTKGALVSPSRNLENLEITRHWSQSWEGIYTERRYHLVDWVFNSPHHSAEPANFCPPDQGEDKLLREFVEEAKCHNRLNGFSLAFRTSSGGHAGFSATGALEKPSAEQISRVASAARMFEIFSAAERVADAGRTANLTLREIQLIRFLSGGYSPGNIAALFGVTEQWVRRSTMDIRNKLSVRTNCELVYVATATGLLG